MKRPCIIVDLDETLADTRHRQWIVTGREYTQEDYDRYYQNHENDGLYSHISEVVRRFASDHRIVFMTGRPDTYRHTTEQWIWQKTGLVPSSNFELHMRKAGDLRCDTIVKPELYENHVRPKYRVIFVLEDRTKVVKVWRDLGLVCLQVQQSDY